MRRAGALSVGADYAQDGAGSIGENAAVAGFGAKFRVWRLEPDAEAAFRLSTDPGELESGGRGAFLDAGRLSRGVRRRQPRQPIAARPRGTAPGLWAGGSSPRRGDRLEEVSRERRRTSSTLVEIV